MKTLSNLDVLQLWERGTSLHPLDRALLTLATTLPEQRSDELADWTLGRRNSALAAVLHVCFGAKMEGWVACPRCDERLEFALDATALEAAYDGDSQTGGTQIRVRERGFRLPTSRDLARIAGESDPGTAALRLLQICCVDGGEADGWTAEELDEAGDELAKADPMAETRVNLSCAECGEQWEETLDVAAWLWTEIESQARRLVGEVHLLASAYGWSEAEVLSLSAQRRSLYLEMVQL